MSGQAVMALARDLALPDGVMEPLERAAAASSDAAAGTVKRAAYLSWRIYARRSVS